MPRAPKLPDVKVITQSIVLGGGLDLITPPGFAKPGTCRFALNYEADFGGGYSRVGGFERYDGQHAPHLAEYVVLEADAGFVTIVPGVTVVGETSGADGVVVWISADYRQVGITKMTPGFTFTEENLLLSGSPVGLVTNSSAMIDGFTDNDIAYLAAEEYRQDIQKPPGTGPVRGVQIINNAVYAWRDDGDEQFIYRATPAGWELVDLKFKVAFENGATEYAEGDALIQGGVSAAILRVAVQSGSWSGGDAAGLFVIDAPVGGSFSAGAAAGVGACELLGVELPNELVSGGRVTGVMHNFTGAELTKRFYGCDGVNIEFEFDGEVYTPIETGMGSTRATQCFIHKNHLFYAYGPSLQHSGTTLPYAWTPIFGAAELTTGDPITNLISVSGSETSAAMMVTCDDSVWVLYGTSAADWDFRKVSDTAGAQAFSGVSMGSPLAFDREGFNKYTPTQAFGNFSYESSSLGIDPLVRNASVSASVLVKNKSKYRCFFSDGLFVTATPIKGGFAWMPCDYGRRIESAVGGEVNGQYRIFMADGDGWVLEADVGRSFDGEEIEAGMRLSSMNQGSSVLLKQYRRALLQSRAGSAFELALGAEFSDSNPEAAAAAMSSPTDFKKQYGVGLFWDFSSWDQSYWDGAAANLVTYPLNGQGCSVSLLLSSRSDRELPHTLSSVTTIHSPRRLVR